MYIEGDKIRVPHHKYQMEPPLWNAVTVIVISWRKKSVIGIVGYFSMRSASHLLLIRKLFHLNFQLSILPIFFLVNSVLIYLSYKVMNSHQIALKYSLNGIAWKMQRNNHPKHNQTFKIMLWYILGTVAVAAMRRLMETQYIVAP